jgi:hypothetical protein
LDEAKWRAFRWANGEARKKERKEGLEDRNACQCNIATVWRCCFAAVGKAVDNERQEPSMSHHLFILSPSDTPLYSLTHFSTKPVAGVTSPLASNLPTWSTSAFAGTLTALSGATSATNVTSGGNVRVGGGQDRHVIQMIANASLDVVEEVMRKDANMGVDCQRG